MDEMAAAFAAGCYSPLAVPIETGAYFAIGDKGEAMVVAYDAETKTVQRFPMDARGVDGRKPSVEDCIVPIGFTALRWGFRIMMGMTAKAAREDWDQRRAAGFLNPPTYALGRQLAGL